MDELEKIYYDPKNPGSFGGKQRLLNEIRKKYPYFSMSKLEEWISKQDTYTLFKPVKRKFNRLPIIVSHLNEQWQADLLDMGWYASHNDGYRYLLVVINVLSRFAWVQPLKNKKAESIIEAFKKIITKENKPDKIQTDQGTEFKNKFFIKMMNDLKINFFTTTNDDIKCAIVERFNRTLRERLYRVMNYKNTFRYIDDLQDVVESYNNSYHRTIEMTPSEVTKDNELDVIRKIKKNRETKSKDKPIPVGSIVRIARKKGLFEKGAESGWKKELFRIASKKKTPIKHIYKLEDLDKEPITSIFYPEELTKTEEKERYEIEKIIRKRKNPITKKQEYFVKWLGYPDKFNSWIDNIEAI